MNIKEYKFLTSFLWLLVFFTYSFSVQAQTTPPKTNLPANVENHKLNSKLLAREIPYRVVLPVDYKSANEKIRYPVVYLLHGLTGHFNNWTDKTKLADYAAKYNYIIVTPEGNNGWYSDSLAVATDKYESYIVRELIPEIDRKFRTNADRNQRAIAGLSMGGYGSIKFGLKYPEMFTLVGSFSGALGAASFSKKTSGAIGEAIYEIFGAEGEENRNSNDIFKLIREMPDDKIKNLPFIYLDCGTEDFLFKNNRDYVNLLIEKKVKHEFRQLPGAHDWKFWDPQVKEFLEVSEKFLSRVETK